MPRRVNLRLLREPAVTVSRASIYEDEIIYVFTADKKIQYPNGRSRIVYIGKTEAGISRVTSSAAYRAKDILDESGVYLFEAKIVHYPKDQIDRRQTWRKTPPILLERALLIAFSEKYGKPPLCNDKGAKMKASYGEFTKFSRSRVDRIIEDLS